MSFIARLQRAREILEQQARVSTRALERELQIGGDELEELIEELVDVQQIARREGRILVWAGTPAAATIEREPRASTPTNRPADRAEARKVVTIVFADLIGSTSLHERLDAESTRRLMDRYYRALHTVVESHGGTVVKLMGDGVMAAFGVPRVAEDDAIRAVRAGVAMQDAFRALAHEAFAAVGDIGLRVGINTGEVVVSADNTDVVGDPVNVAARLQQEARDGEVVVGESTRRLVAMLVTLAPLGSVALKGRAEAMKAYRVESLERPAGAIAAAFVGRDDELKRVRAVYEAAVAKPAARLAVLLGSPGLGKSRLIDEIISRLGDAATVVLAHCDAAGGATFAPIADGLREFLHVDDGGGAETLRAALEAAVPGEDGDRARIIAGIGAFLTGSPSSLEETFFVVRRLLAALATVKPVVLVIDDLHWAEPLLLDLVEHLVQWGSGVPLLVLVGARPELRDTRSSLTMPGNLVAEVVTLAGLDAGAATRLAANVIGAADLPAAVAAKVLATSEGNPLFVAELVRMLVQEGALKREGDRWTTGVGLAALEMPPTIHALLAARIERLRPEERNVLERAAVVGRHFSRGAVAALLPREASDLDARLESLRRSELIEPDTGWLLGEPVLRFHHVLIRDAAYRRLLKGTRAELHARFANWVEARAPDAMEHDESIGWHLEQAHQHLLELGPIDAQGRALGERAARYLASAGRRALARDDLSLAAGLLGRALERLDVEAPARAELALDWCEALLAAGDVGPAATAIDELAHHVGDPEQRRLRAWHTCFTGQLTALTAPESLHATVAAVAAAAAELAALGDIAGEAKAHFVHAQAFARLGKIGACEAALDRALAAARRAGDRRRANTVLAVAPLAALWGPSPVTRASGRCLDVVRVLRITQGAPAVEAVALSCQGVLEALRGRTDAARRMIASARKMVEELGITQRLLEVDVFAGRIELLEGDAPAAERCLRGAYEGLRDLGLGIDAARAAALLGRALLAQDRAGEAETLSRESEALAGDDLQASIAWRGVRAEALARRGEHADAVDLAKAAVEIAAATDALLDHADARLALAAALRAAGSSGDADAEKRHATELWETKGATLLAERVGRDETQTEAMPRATEPRVDSRGAVQRRVRGNAATASMVRFDAAKDPVVRHEPLATLGESLGLFRRHISAGGTTGGRLDVADFEREEFVVTEPGVVIEIFAADHLGDAIARLYARHAELLPEGPDRQRAEVTARALAYILTDSVTPDATSLLFSPSYEDIDHRSVGYGKLSTDEATKLAVSQRALADDLRFRVEDVLALRPDGLVRRTTTSGTWRDGGGAFERTICMLSLFGPDGRAARQETFDSDREAEAQARFDELVRSPVDGTTAVRRGDPGGRRHVRANAATAYHARFDAALAARDFDALAALNSESFQEIDHPTGSTYGFHAAVASLQRLFRSRDPYYQVEPLATLGPSLLLIRRRTGASAAASGRYDVGAYENQAIQLMEVDERGLQWRSEVFAVDCLGDAIVRLYERYAELLPDGPARVRATARARTIATLYGPFDVSRTRAACAPDIEIVDHRLEGFGPMRGVENLERIFASASEVAEDLVDRCHDVLALQAGALVVRWTTAGRSREGGGAFEWPHLRVVILGSDGRFSRLEVFGADQEDEALARFDELVAGEDEAPAVEASEPFANAASRSNDRMARCWAARDWEGVLDTLSPALRWDDRRRLMRLEIGFEDFVVQFRMLFDQPASRWHEPLLATRGERLSLHRTTFEAEVEGGGGPLAFDDHLSLGEVDADGRWFSVVTFDLDDLDAAYAELDARYVAGESAAHGGASAWRRAFRRLFEDRDWDALTALCAPTLVAHDHRLTGWGTQRGPAAWVQALRSLVDLAPDVGMRVDHVRTSDRGFLNDVVQWGTRDGGAFEIPVIAVFELDEQSRLHRLDLYDPGQLEPARARFDAIDVGAAPDLLRIPPNAVWRMTERWAAAGEAQNWEGIEAIYAPVVTWEDRRRLLRATGDRETALANDRLIWGSGRSGVVRTLLATAGERLALMRFRWIPRQETEHFEIDTLLVAEIDAEGRNIASITFDPDDRAAAAWELAERYVRLTRPERLQGFNDRRDAGRNLARVRARLPDDFFFRDHRRTGLGRIEGADSYLASVKALFELSPDVVIGQPLYVLADEPHATLAIAHSFGTLAEGGAFESVYAMITVYGSKGLAGAELFELDDLEAAKARFEELCAASAT